MLPILPLPTPVKVNRLEFLLEGYDFQKRMFLIDGFKYGFHLFPVGQSRSYESPNLLSARQQPQVVDQKLAKEPEAHRLAGPFDSPPFPVFRVSALGIVPKKTPPGRCFLRRLIDLTIGLKRPGHFVRVSNEVKADLFTWQQFFQEYNGKSFFLNEKWENCLSLQLFTDAAGAHGFGPVFGSHRCYGEWPKEWLGQNIAILEFYPIVLSLMLWGDHIRDRCITFFTDNEALVHVVNKSTCRDTSLMIFVRKLLLVCLRHSILFKAKHISGFKNTLADALSRLQIERFKKLAPAYMDPMPTAIPSHLLPVNWHQKFMIFYPLVYRSLQYQRTVGHGSFMKNFK